MAKCGLETEVYSRVVGYWRPVSQWNPGKQAEFEDRKEFKLKEVGHDVVSGSEADLTGKSSEKEKCKAEDQEQDHILFFEDWQAAPDGDEFLERAMR